MRIPTFTLLLVTTSFFLNAVPAMAQSYDCAAQDEVSQAECEILVKLYNSTDGDNWNNNNGWLSDPVSQWHGVGVDGGDITYLDLRANNLSGEILPDLGQLAALQYLYLSGNNLSGAIPAELGQLTNLQTLYLSENKLTGVIPPELGGLTNLQTLYLGFNSLNGAIPPELGQLTNLKLLFLSNNHDLGGSIPLSFTNLTALTDFWFDNTNLCEPKDPDFQAWLNSLSFRQRSGLVCPSEYDCAAQSEVPQTQCNALVTLYNNNDGDNWTNNSGWLNTPLSQWYGVEISEGHVTTLNLSDNNISKDLPAELGQLVNLQRLNFSKNPDLGGSIPLSFTNLTLLTHFWFDNTSLCEPQDLDFQTWLGGLSTLTRTSIACGDHYCSTQSDITQTECEVLTTLYNATGGENWDENHWLSAPVSRWHGVEISGDRVTELDLSGFNLSGTIPAELGQLTHLHLLDLAGNDLAGSIPPELGQLTDLLELNLSYNDLNGAIPPNLGQLTSLQLLDLRKNNLSEAIPSELGQLTDLLELNLRENNLSGVIPAELGQLSKLHVLDLYKNSLTGALPPELGQLTNLQQLNLRDNNLSGSIPFSFTNLIVLEAFSYVGTSLCVPRDPEFQRWLSGISALIQSGLVCTAENFDCIAQSEISQTECEALIMLYTSTDGDNWKNNSGWFSTPVSQWRGLEISDGHVTTLDLSVNKLSGPIPLELTQLSNLQVLALGGNSLTGSIPSELAQLSNLQELNLWNNSLSGTIPLELGQLNNLQSLDLAANNLDGPISPELGQLSELQELFLWGNNISGTIPPELGQLTNLQILALGDNTLSGSIPSKFGQLKDLQVLSLALNNLSGVIPVELSQLSKLQGLRLDDNNLIGEIPPEFGQFTGLQELWLNDNNFSGPIPLSLANLSVLELFYFDNTSLCEPQEPDFQTWLAGIDDLQRTDMLCSPTSTEPTADLPQTFALEANYPNPFNPTTTITYALPEAVHVTLVIYDVLGREQIRLVDGPQTPGVYRARFDAAGLPSGVYLYRLEAGAYRATKTLTLAK